MTLIHVRANAVRSLATPAAATETLASPTVGGTISTSLWRVRMVAGSTGPRHTIDSEQIWTVLSGRATVRDDVAVVTVTTGDTVVMSGGSERTVSALDDCEFLVCGSPTALASVPDSDSAPVSPPWVL